MKIKVQLSFSGELTLPQHYNHILQGVIYNWINDENYSSFLHNQGFQHEKRTYKLFSFSKLYGSFTMNKARRDITFYDKVYIYLSSMDENFLTYLTHGLIATEAIHIKGKEVMVTGIEIIKESPREELEIYTLSPITMASTIFINEKKKTYYYNPSEEEFEELIRKNLIKKYISFFNREPSNTEFYIKKGSKEPKEAIINYKGFTIKGWSGEFNLKGSIELIDTALKCGLGAKNSQGFGCIAIKSRP